MTAVTFDTLAFTKKLKKAGVPEKQAEAHTEVTAEIMKEIVNTQVATKKDLHTLHLSIQRDLANLRTTLTLQMGAMIVGGVTLVPLVLKIISLI